MTSAPSTWATPATLRSGRCTPAPSSTWPRPSTRQAGPTGAAPALLADVELPLVTVLAQMEQLGIAVDTERLEELESGFGEGVRTAAQEAYDVIGKEINLGSPKQLQVVLFDELEHAEDQAHEDRLHHRRRRTAVAAREDRAPVPAAPAAPPRRHPAASDRGGPAQDGAARRSDPHHLQPAHRRHRAALQHRPEPAEHPRAHRGGAPHPRGVRGRRGLRVADDGRLQPDRDADHGPPLGGRRPDRVVPLGHGLPLRDRVAGLRRGAVRGHRRDARQDQGDELRPGLRAVGLRALPAAQDRAGRGPRDDGRVLRDLRGRARLPRWCRRRGAPFGLHRDHHRPPPLPAGPDQRQPPAARDGRADGAERPDPGLGRRHHQGRHAQGRHRDPRRGPGLTDAAAGPRRARARGGAGGARGAGGAGTPRDGRRGRPHRVAGRLGRHRHTAGTKPLTDPWSSRRGPPPRPRPRPPGRPRAAATS